MKKPVLSFDTLIKKIKQKKELAGIPDEVVKIVVQKIHTRPEKLAVKEQHMLIKEARASLRTLVGQYQTSQKKRTLPKTQEEITQLLKTHTSTAERLTFYPELIAQIKKLNPASILDIGCGLNPLALAPEFKKTKYYATDIKEDDLALIKVFFTSQHIRGTTMVFDAQHHDPAKLPAADLCVMFKVLDIIDTKKHTLTKKLLDHIPAKRFLISFATKKLSGKHMTYPNRSWFETILNLKNLSFETFHAENEVFYYLPAPVAKKESRPA